MAREYFQAFHSYLESIEPLNDAERGRLFTALLEYSMTGTAEKLSGNERFVFPTLKANIDREMEKYAEKSKTNRKNGTKGGRPPKPKETEKKHSVFEKPNISEKSQDKEKDHDEDNDEGNDKDEDKISPPIGGDNPPKSPQGGGARAKKPKAVDAFAEFAGDDAEMLAAFRGFEEMRKMNRKPLTDGAKKRAVAKLQRLSSDRAEQIAILNKSEDKAWDDLYPLKEPRYDLQAEKQRNSPPKDDSELLRKMLGKNKKEDKP